MSLLITCLSIEIVYISLWQGGKMKRIFCLTLILSVMMIIMAPVLSYAASSATQSASTRNFTAISIKAQDYQTDVSNITFPIGSPGTTVSNPYNVINTNSSPQAFGEAGSARPVLTLVNTDASHQYYIYYNISAWSNSVVASEYYLINDKGVACTNDSAITNAVVFNANTNTGSTIAPSPDTNGCKKDLYLKVLLSNTGGLSGTSTISIISEVN
jgi:hypothetical protein